MADELIPRPLLKRVAERFKLLSEPVRLELLNHLHVHGEMNVQALTEATGQHQANVSKHLRLLSEEGIVERRKDGVYSYYRIVDPIVSTLCVIVCSHLREESIEAVDAAAQ